MKLRCVGCGRFATERHICKYPNQDWPAWRVEAEPMTPTPCPECGYLLEDTPQVIYCADFSGCGYRKWKQDEPETYVVERVVHRDTWSRRQRIGVPTQYVQRLLKTV